MSDERQPVDQPTTKEVVVQASRLPGSLDRKGAGETPAPQDLTDIVAMVRKRTPARLLVGHAGAAYRTATQLELRRDHAVALDAVHTEIDMVRDFGPPFLERWGLFEVSTTARTKAQYLMRPDFGRRLDESARSAVTSRCSPGADLQIAIGDGLSATAIVSQVPDLLPLIEERARELAWSFGQPFLIRHCRVGVLNDIGDLLQPTIAVLLIGERPGLATAESLSAYLAFRPRGGQTDANRNLISNIHRRGVSCEAAADRIMALAMKMRKLVTSGVEVKEDLETDRSLSGGPAGLGLPDESR